MKRLVRELNVRFGVLRTRARPALLGVNSRLGPYSAAYLALDLQSNGVRVGISMIVGKDFSRGFSSCPSQQASTM